MLFSELEFHLSSLLVSCWNNVNNGRWLLYVCQTMEVSDFLYDVIERSTKNRKTYVSHMRQQESNFIGLIFFSTTRNTIWVKNDLTQPKEISSNREINVERNDISEKYDIYIWNIVNHNEFLEWLWCLEKKWENFSVIKIFTFLLFY